MRVLIVEDETTAFENLSQMLSVADPTLEIVGNTEGVQQTVRWLRSNPQPDIIFMDIHLSDGSAFTIFEMMEVEMPIIFTTAYDQYAIDAFRVNSIDYLLKPVKQERLESALTKLRKLSKSDLEQYIGQMAKLRPVKKYSEKILIAVKDKLIPIKISDISCFYFSEGETTIYMRDGRTLPYAKSLEQIINRLDPKLFMRANRQYIVARDSVTDITMWFDNRLRISLDVQIPEQIYISKNKASEFKRWIIAEDNE